MWFWSRSVAEAAPIKSDWQAVQEHAQRARSEIQAGWGLLTRHFEAITEKLCSRSVADRANTVFHAIPWTLLGILCPTFLIPPALGAYYFVKVQYGPFSEENTKNTCNGIGIALGLSAISHMAFVTQPMHLLSSVIYGVACYYLLKKGSLIPS